MTEVGKAVQIHLSANLKYFFKHHNNHSLECTCQESRRGFVFDNINIGVKCAKVWVICTRRYTEWGDNISSIAKARLNCSW